MCEEILEQKSQSNGWNASLNRFQVHEILGQKKTVKLMECLSKHVSVHESHQKRFSSSILCTCMQSFTS